MMRQLLWDTIKVFVIFITCTVLFYIGLRAMHTEYEQYHRYETPEGPAVKAVNLENDLIERLNVFFRLGE